MGVGKGERYMLPKCEKGKWGREDALIPGFWGVD